MVKDLSSLSQHTPEATAGTLLPSALQPGKQIGARGAGQRLVSRLSGLSAAEARVTLLAGPGTAPKTARVHPARLMPTRPSIGASDQGLRAPDAAPSSPLRFVGLDRPAMSRIQRVPCAERLAWAQPKAVTARRPLEALESRARNSISAMQRRNGTGRWRRIRRTPALPVPQCQRRSCSVTTRTADGAQAHRGGTWPTCLHAAMDVLLEQGQVSRPGPARAGAGGQGIPWAMAGQRGTGKARGGRSYRIFLCVARCDRTRTSVV